MTMWYLETDSSSSLRISSSNTSSLIEMEVPSEHTFRNQSSQIFKFPQTTTQKMPNSALYRQDSISSKINGRVNKQLYNQAPPQIQPKPNTSIAHDEIKDRFKRSPDPPRSARFQNSDETQSLNGILNNNNNDDFTLPSNPPQFDSRNFDEISVASSTNSFDLNGMSNRNGNNHGRTNSLITVNGFSAFGKEMKSKPTHFGSTNQNDILNRTANATSNESISSNNTNGRYRGVSVKVSKHSSSEHLVNTSNTNNHNLGHHSRRAVSQNYLNKDTISDQQQLVGNDPMIRNEHHIYSTHIGDHHSTLTKRTPSYQTTMSGHFEANNNNNNNVRSNQHHHQDYNPLNEINNGHRGYLSYTDSRHHKSEIALPTQDFDGGRGRSRNAFQRNPHETPHNESTIGLNENSGPSFRRIQNMNSSNGPASRRFPSDTHLHETKQVYTSGGKPGPVTIPARSRSAQPSPAHSPRNSPPRFASSRYDTGNEEDEYQILPSVREIIRQVEAMTHQQESSSVLSTKSYSTSKRDINANSLLSSGAKINNGGNASKCTIERYNSLSGKPRNNHHMSQITVNRSSYTNQSELGIGGKVNGHFQGNTANSNTSSSIRNNVSHNGSLASLNGPAVPPIPPHAPIILNSSQNTSKIDYYKNGNLPSDYNKLREAFLEQRKELQRLRKEICEKDAEINRLRSDIRLYEPWH